MNELFIQLIITINHIWPEIVNKLILFIISYINYYNSLQIKWRNWIKMSKIEWNRD